MHGSVSQLNPGIVSLLEALGRRGQGPLTVDRRHSNPASSQDFVSKAVQGLEWYFHSAGRLSAHSGLHKRCQNRSQRDAASDCSGRALFVRPVKIPQ